MSRAHAPHESEASDVHPRKVLWTAAALIAAIVLTHVIVYLLIFRFHGPGVGNPLLGNSVPRLPADLRQFDFPSVETFRRHEQQTLESYAWTDPAHGIAQVPIERAIELYVQAQGGEPMGRGSARAHCAVPTYTLDVNGCHLVFLPSVFERQRAGSVGASMERRR